MILSAVILSTGDELITGKVVDTNSAYIADRLLTAGIAVAAVLKVGDDREKILWALRQARDLGDLVIGTGGLGPTADDLTTELVAAFTGRKLILNDAVAGALKHRFAARGYPWTENNLKQALFPDGATIIPNPLGTAPGFRLSLGENKNLIWLSGVPREMTAMMNDEVLPWIERQQGGDKEILTATFKLFGLTESKLDDLLKNIDLSAGAKLSFRAHYPDLTLRLTMGAPRANRDHFTTLSEQIRSALGSFVYAEGDVVLEEVVGRLLLEKQLTLALAESCTGGLISHRITRVAGCSAYYYGAAVSYADEAKMKFLGVRASTLRQHGAVSEQTALEMARGIREQTAAQIGLAVTGIAGPTGGSPEKPVGTVWIGIADRRRHEARRWQLHGEREQIILGASQAALNWLRLFLTD